MVLVHGAFADASGWSAVVRMVQAAGYPVIAPADPLRGLTADADHIRSVVATLPGPVILVGHSYGGAVITNAAREAANVVALVYIAAFIPDQGTSVATSYEPPGPPRLAADAGRTRGAPHREPCRPRAARTPTSTSARTCSARSSPPTRTARPQP